MGYLIVVVPLLAALGHSTAIRKLDYSDRGLRIQADLARGNLMLLRVFEQLVAA